ncbi:MAG: hypothetical protein ACRCZU_13175 [Selenomonadaceae bacterium]
MGPIRGQTRPVPVEAGVVPEIQRIDAKLNASIHNRFDIEVIDAMTGNVKQRAKAENVICAGLWTRLLTPSTYFNYIHYGTGSGTPSSTDSSLFTFLGYGTPSTSDDVYTNDISGVLSLRRKIVLLETVAVGSTLTEFGIAYSTASSSLCTHAMLKDMNGNQISITKTSTDIVNIYATVFVHYPAFSESASIYATPIPDYAGLLVSAFDGFSKWLLGLATPNIAGCVYHNGALCSANRNWTYGTNVYVETTPSYSIANKTLTITASRLAAASGNGDGLLTANLTPGDNMFGFLHLLTGGNWYTGTSITGEAIGTGDGSTKDFTTDFPVISAPSIYADGVLVSSGITIDLNRPRYIRRMGTYFRLVQALVRTYVGLEAGNVSSGDVISGYQIYYNPFYSLGIDSFNWTGGTWVSNDLETWVSLGTGSPVTVPAAYKQYKYWKFYWNNQSGAPSFFVTSGATATNIHFDSAPASGVAITGDYTTKAIGKDVNHVFDLTVTIQFGEHTS